MGNQMNFPSIQDPASIVLSVVVPAYNEEKRLTPMLEAASSYLEERARDDRDFTWEIIVVNDGSSDQTAQMARRFVDRYGSERVRVLNLMRNRGKGGAVKRGVLSARGQNILFADADGASEIQDLAKLEQSLALIKTPNAHGMSIGSRAHLEEESIAKRSTFRTILMFGFHFAVKTLLHTPIRDTQCGFKLFTRETARVVFSNLHVERWAFDCELIMIAVNKAIPISEISIRWTEVEGSKLSPTQAAIEMALDLVRIRFLYFFGIWNSNHS